MILDYLLMFTEQDGQKVTADAASDYRLDFGQESPTTGHDPDRLTAVFTVKEDVTGKLQIKLQDCDEETGTYTDVALSQEYDAPVAGTLIPIPMPYHHKRFMQAYFSGATAGTIVGFITSGFQDNEPFKQAPSLDGIG